MVRLHTNTARPRREKRERAHVAQQLAVRRIMSDLKELNTDPSDQYWAEPRGRLRLALRPARPAGHGVRGHLPRPHPLPPDYPLAQHHVSHSQRALPDSQEDLPEHLGVPSRRVAAGPGVRTILEALISFFPDGEAPLARSIGAHASGNCSCLSLTPFARPCY